ncbi:MAG TPA: hypothetical protein VFY30_04630 [Solirubrobacterales bacterium]|nr:hypothetical protein [Solirubrobacterales bacterium]
MADLTTLEEKLAEVTGLAKAAQEATQKVEGLVDDEELTSQLQRMRQEAEETEQRCTQLADERDGKKTAILEKAQETKNEAVEMMSTYLGSDADDLDGFEFLTRPRPARSATGRSSESSTRRPVRRRFRSWSSGPCRSRSGTSRRSARDR